jgi:hypothetical protein
LAILYIIAKNLAIFSKDKAQRSPICLKIQISKLKCQIKSKIQGSKIVLDFDLYLKFGFWHLDFDARLPNLGVYAMIFSLTVKSTNIPNRIWQ